MKYKINLDNFSHKSFNSKSEWDKYLEPMIKTPKAHYSPQPRDLHPYQFPCLMLYDDNQIFCISSGNDEFPNFFFYDFEKIEEEDV